MVTSVTCMDQHLSYSNGFSAKQVSLQEIEGRYHPHRICISKHLSHGASSSLLTNKEKTITPTNKNNILNCRLQCTTASFSKFTSNILSRADLKQQGAKALPTINAILTHGRCFHIFLEWCPKITVFPYIPMRCCCSPILTGFRPLNSSPTQVQFPDPEGQCCYIQQRKDPLGKINSLPWCHAINSQQKQQSTASLVLPLSSTHAGRRWGYCHCHWPNKPCSNCETHFDFPTLLPHPHFSRSSFPCTQSTVMAFCAALWCRWDVSGVGMHLASLIQQPSFKRGAFLTSFHNNKGSPNTPSPPSHMWFLYYLLSPALPSSL